MHGGAKIVVFQSAFLASHSMAEIAVIAVLALIAAAAIGWVSFRLPKSVLLGIVLAAAMLQGFKPVGYVSISLLLPIAMAPAIVASSKKAHWDLWAKLGLGILVWQVISAIWAVKLGSVAHAALSTAVLVVCYLLARQVAADPGGLAKALRIASPFVVLEALLTVLFRMAPAVEAAYYGSPVAMFFSEPNVELMLTGIPQNVSDPGKAGGLLLSGNVASLLLVLVSCVYAYAYIRLRKTLFAVVSLIALVGCIATGSKTALALLVLLPALAIVSLFLIRKSKVAYLFLGLLLAGFGGLIVFLGVTGSQMFTTSVTTLGDRGRLWALAGQGFLEHPVLGLGYGGWSEYLKAHADAVFEPDRWFQDFPPHNLVIQAWADAGIPLAILVSAIALLPICISVRLLWRLRADRVFSSATLRTAVLSIGSVWIIVHAMADTTGFFGENHTLPFLSLIVALLAYEAGTLTHDRAGDDDTANLDSESKSVMTQEGAVSTSSAPASRKSRI